MNKEYKPRLLHFAAYADPVLHKKTALVQFPLSQEDKNLIADMLYSIQPEQIQKANGAWESPAGMAANQWGINKSIFLYCPYGETKHATVVINPSYEHLATLAIIAPSERTDWEGCFSIPLACGCIRRSTKIKARYQDETGKVIEETMTGYKARVWQHETDHTNGYLYDDPRLGRCIEKRVFKSREAVDDFYSEIRDERRKQ